MTQQEFLALAVPAAKTSQANGGAPWQFAVAQSALETGYGKHAPQNMFFGIKAGKSWKGKRQLLTTTEYTASGTISLQPGESIVSKTAPGAEGNKSSSKYKLRIKAYFRAYNTPAESFQDHARLMQEGRYKDAFLEKNPKAFARYVANAGYATDPSYIGKITAIMDRLDGRTPAATTKPKTTPTPQPEKADSSFLLFGSLLLVGTALAIRRSMNHG